MKDKLIKINDKLIEINKNNYNELNKQLLIKSLLNEENLFLNIPIEDAFGILRDLKIEEDDLEKVYLELI